MRTLLLLAAMLGAAAARADARPGEALAHASAQFRALHREAKVRALARAGPALLGEGARKLLEADPPR
jgi:hypothetical protein